MNTSFARQNGFTLLEIIISLILAGILGSMLISFSGKALTQSGDAANTMASFYQRNQVIDTIYSYYFGLVAKRKETALSNLESSIASGDFNTSQVTVTAQYITYSSTNPPVEQSSSGSDLLKVTATPVSGISGAVLTVLFAN